MSTAVRQAGAMRIGRDPPGPVVNEEDVSRFIASYGLHNPLGANHMFVCLFIRLRPHWRLQTIKLAQVMPHV